MNVKVQAGQLFADPKSYGTQDEEFLRVMLGKGDRPAQLHLCDTDCGQVLTDETLVHGKVFETVDLRTAPWMTNLKPAGGDGTGLAS